MAQSRPSRRVKSLYNPPSLVFRQALALAYHGWLTGWRGLPVWMLKGKKVLATAAGATAIGCTGYPYHVVWEVSTHCNLDCIHCYASSVESKQAELSAAEGKHLLEQIAESDRFRMIVITGGEPLLRNDIYELMEHAGKLGLRIVFSTSGTLLTPDTARDLTRLGVVNFSISLDGSSPESHESIRRKPGCFQSTVKGIEAAARTGACLQINFTAMRQNLAELPGVIDLAESLRADIIMVFQAIPPRREVDGLGLEAEAQMQLIKIIAEKQTKTRALIMPVGCPEYWPWLVQRQQPFFKGVANRLLSGCGAGSGFVYIRSDGDIWPCNFIPVAAGNVRQKSFSDIWDYSDLLREFREGHKRLKGACGGCSYNSICGGCRGRAFSLTSDPLAADPNCILNL